MKYGLVAGFALFVCLVAVFMNSGETPPAVPESAPVVQESVEEPVERMTPYQYGYLKGRRSMLIQLGSDDVPSLPAVAEYTSSEEDSEEEGKGYVDGYHRAGEMSCPRGCTR